MKVTLEINDNKAAAFINFIKSLDFVHIHSEEDYKEPTKQEIIESIRQGMKEVQLHQEGKIKLQSARDFLNEL
ncbi:hypothetical protein [Aquiflexum lacus]|uniref:hypothetical protein n=1 Tax=Aquiflexum lacus TaxID=2483805 RepID=UPI0018950913|nr:hypothetical protein [Aquiflexum lacus]